MLDNPIVNSMLFYPRSATMGGSSVPNAIDGTLPVAEGVALGYRFYPAAAGQVVVLYFHGNGEVVPDHDFIAPAFHALGASLLVMDYRGYGWSSGEARLSNLLADVQPLHEALPDLLPDPFQAQPLYLMGRSLGSIPAIEMSHRYPQRFQGLIIESGIGHSLTWLASKGFLHNLIQNMPDPIGNTEKIKAIPLPLLLIHGEQDTLLPPIHGQALYDLSPAQHKVLWRVPSAGHNNLLQVAPTEYFAKIRDFISATQAPDSP